TAPAKGCGEWRGGKDYRSEPTLYSRFFFSGGAFSSSLKIRSLPHLGHLPENASLTPSFSQTNFLSRSTPVISAFVVSFQIMAVLSSIPFVAPSRTRTSLPRISTWTSPDGVENDDLSPRSSFDSCSYFFSSARE